MFGTGSIVDQFAAMSAFLATAVALGGFLGHAPYALLGHDERELRRATAKGGLLAFLGAIFVGVLSAVFDIVTG